MRIKRGNAGVKRHKKILKLAKGFIGARSRIFKVANIAVMKALVSITLVISPVIEVPKIVCGAVSEPNSFVTISNNIAQLVSHG